MRTLLLILLLTVTAGLAAGGCADGPPPISRAPATSTTLFPTVSTNDFHPDGQDLSSCGPGVERPGCGSKAKGGWRMALVFAALMLGIAVVATAVVRSARARGRAVNQPTGDWS